MPAISRLGAHIISQEEFKPEPAISWFQMWKGILNKSLTSFSIIQSQQRRIRHLEDALRDSVHTVSELEQVIMEHGETDDTPKTLRHKLLKIVDEKFHQKTRFLDLHD